VAMLCGVHCGVRQAAEAVRALKMIANPTTTRARPKTKKF